MDNTDRNVNSCRYLRVEETSKVCVKTLIPADELIGEGQTVHEAPLLQPEDTAEAALQHNKVSKESCR